jgi:hypothetical protein
MTTQTEPASHVGGRNDPIGSDRAEPLAKLEDPGPIAGWLFVLGTLAFVVAWALMPLPGTRDTELILREVALVRESVWASAAIQMLAATMWAVAVVLVPTPPRARRTWWAGLALFSVGATVFDAADAIFHLVAYELTAPGVAPETARGVMLRMQGPDLAFLVPSLLALAAGIVVLSIAAVRAGLVPRTTYALFGIALGIIPLRLASSGPFWPWILSLAIVTVLVSPIAAVGAALARRDGPA